MQKQLWETKDLKTKATRGIKTADSANSAVRAILGSISKNDDNLINEAYIKECLTFFNYKCPYTGEDLRKYDKNDIVIDHIVPINKEYCGLNVRGNLVPVLKSANYKKSGKSVEEYFEKNKIKDAKKKLKRIKDFQKKYNYNPEKVKNAIGKQIESSYNDIKNCVEKYKSKLSRTKFN